MAFSSLKWTVLLACLLCIATVFSDPTAQDSHPATASQVGLMHMERTEAKEKTNPVAPGKPFFDPMLMGMMGLMGMWNPYMMGMWSPWMMGLMGFF